MSLSVSSFPGAPSKPTTRPTWGAGPSSNTKRWFFGGRLNTGGSSLMKGIRHIGKVQLKSSVARFAHKPSSQNSRPVPARLSVRASTIVIDIIAVPHDDEHQSSEDKTHDDPAPTPVPDPTSWPRWRTVPLLARIPRARANSSGAGGAVLNAAPQARTRVNLEAAKAACRGTATTSLSEKFKVKEIGPVLDLPVVTLSPTDDGDLYDSPSKFTPNWKDELSNGNSSLLRPETRPTPLRRSMSSPTIKHAGNWNRIQPPPPPSPLPLLSVHIARLRTGSRPDPSTPLPPLFAIGPRPKTAPTTRVTKPVPLTALPLAPRTATDHSSCSTTRDAVDSGSRRSPSNLSRSRSQPQLRAKRSTGASASDRSLSRAGSTSSALTQEGNPRSAPPAVPCARRHNIPCRCCRRNGRAATGGASGTCRGEWAREEQFPRTAPEPGYVAWPMSPIVVMDPRTALEMRETGATVARQQARYRRLRNGPR
jgi:hypothetical protein